MIEGRLLLKFSRLAGKILLNHKRNLEGYRVIKLAKIKAGELSYLLKSVYEGVTVYEELSRSLGNVKVVLEEALYCHEGLVVERLKRSLLEYLGEEHLAKGGRKLVNKSAVSSIYMFIH